MLNLGILASSGAAVASYDPTTDTNLIAWFDSSDTDSITDAAGAVSVFDDISTNGSDHTGRQTTGSHQPITDANTINSLNVINYPSSDSLLLDTQIDFMDRTFLFVVKTTNTASQTLISRAGTTPNIGLRLGNLIPEVVAAINPWGGHTPSVSVTSGAASIVGFSGGVKVGYSVNDSSVVSGNDRANSDPFLFDLIGCRNVTSNPFIGDMGEILVLDEVLTGADLLLRIEYLNNKWACY